MLFDIYCNVWFKTICCCYDGNIQQATKEQIFLAESEEHLTCRHADPAAAMRAYGAVFIGKNVALKNPLGMYIQSF